MCTLRKLWSPDIKVHVKSDDARAQVGRGDAPDVLLECSTLGVGYHGRAILDGCNLSIRAGELWALVGANGSGKTTLLRTILGLMKPISGHVTWSAGTQVGYVPQRSSLDLGTPARVIDVVRSGVDRSWSFLSPFHIMRHREEVAQAMRQTHTQDLARMRYAHLSEGQKQRVLMARALVSDARLLVLDEPTSAMDMQAEHEIFVLLDRIRHARHLGVVLVSHHLPVVAEFATHVCLIDGECDEVLSGPVAQVAEHDSCRAHYGKILRDGMSRRLLHLCALDEQQCDHAHAHEHHAHEHHAHEFEEHKQ